MTKTSSRTLSLLALFAAGFFAQACSSGDSQPQASCKIAQGTTCDTISDPIVCGIADGCQTAYHCTGTPRPCSSYGASGCRDNTHFHDHPGCTVTSSGCSGTPDSCEEHSENSYDCESLGCTLSMPCVGSLETRFCSQQTNANDCAEQGLGVCEWR